MGLMTAGKGIEMDLLWTNPNPTLSFSPQTVNVDISSYDFIGITALASSARSPGVMHLVPCELMDNESSITEFGTDPVCRLFKIISDGVKFGTGGAAGGKVENAFAIPVAVYGIKL